MSIPPEGSFLSIWAPSQARAVNVAETLKFPRPSDEDVLARLDAKDSDALSVLFDRYSKLVFSVALRILHDHGEAEEIVQEVFLQVFQKASYFDPSKGTAKTWIVRIAFHRALDRKSYLDRRGFYVNTDIGCINDSLSGETNLDREVGAKVNRVQLQKAFEELPEMQRRTLELFYFQGMELRQIVENLNESYGNVRHHLYRGLERLRNSTFVERIRET